MKYAINLNQAGIANSEFLDDTDVTDWILIDYIKEFASNPAAKFYDNHVWIDLNNLMLEMPLLKLSSKQAASRRIKKLVDKGLITRSYDEKNRLHLRISQASYDVVTYSAYSETKQKTSDGSSDAVNPGVNSPVNRGVNRVLTGGLTLLLDNKLLVNNIYSEVAAKVINHLNVIAGKNHQVNKINIDLIKARMDEGANEDLLMRVVDAKCKEWSHDNMMKKYLRPATLFNRTKFTQYVGDLPSPNESDDDLEFERFLEAPNSTSNNILVGGE